MGGVIGLLKKPVGGVMKTGCRATMAGGPAMRGRRDAEATGPLPERLSPSQFTSRRLRDFIALDYLLIRIDSSSISPSRWIPWRTTTAQTTAGRSPGGDDPGLLICSLYNISSFRRLSSVIAENIVYRWFCLLTIGDPVFGHSSISYFIERIGREGFSAIFHGLNEELLRLGLRSPEMYAVSSLVKANVHSRHLSRSGLTVDEFRGRATGETKLSGKRPGISRTPRVVCR